MGQNTLLFYGLLELVVILLPLASWWHWRLNKTQRRLEDVWKTFGKLLKRHRRAVADGSKIPSDVMNAYLDALERLAEEEPPGTPESWQALWQELLRPPPSAVPAPTEAVVDPATPPEEDLRAVKELQDVEELLAQQSQQFTALTDYKINLLKLLQGKFSHIQDSNQELLCYVQRQVSDKKGDMHGLLDIVARLEQNNEHLHGMLDGLEKEKSQPDPNLEALYRENYRLRTATTRNIAQARDLQEQKLLWQRKSTELARKLEQRIQAYNVLYRRYDNLRQDYLRMIDKNIAIPAEFPLE